MKVKQQIEFFQGVLRLKLFLRQKRKNCATNRRFRDITGGFLIEYRLT